MLIIIATLIVISIIIAIQYNAEWLKLIEAAKNYQSNHADVQFDFNKKDTFNVFMDLLMNTNLSFIKICLPILIIIPALNRIHARFKSGIYKDFILRMGYKKYMVKEIFNSYLSSLISPMFLLFLLLLAFLFSGHFDIQYTYNNLLGISMNFPVKYMNHPVLFVGILILNIWFISIFFINVSLLLVSKTKNFLLTTLLAFLTITAFQIITEVFLGGFLVTITGNKLYWNLFSLYNLWVYDGTDLIITSTYVLVLVLISTYMVYHYYRKKERVAIENEK